MRKTLILSFITVLVPGIMAGCSKSEKPVQQPPQEQLEQEGQPPQEQLLQRGPVHEQLVQGQALQQRPNVMSAKSLQDILSQADAQARKALEDARSRAGEAVAGSVPVKAAEVTPDMIESYQGVNVSANTLKQNMEARGQSADTGLMSLGKSAAPASADSTSEKA